MYVRRKPRPEDRKPQLPGSLYSAELDTLDLTHYRCTPAGAPDVAVLVHPGMHVCTSYGTGGVVTEVISNIHVTADGREYPHFTIVYVPAGRFDQHSPSGRCWINECVAVHGRILKLFEANSDEVFLGALPPEQA